MDAEIRAGIRKLLSSGQSTERRPWQKRGIYVSLVRLDRSKHMGRWGPVQMTTATRNDGIEIVINMRDGDKFYQPLTIRCQQTDGRPRLTIGDEVVWEAPLPGN